MVWKKVLKPKSHMYEIVPKVAIFKYVVAYIHKVDSTVEENKFTHS